MAPPTPLAAAAAATFFALSMLPHTTAAPLAKRDEYPLPKPVMVLLIIIGAGMAVCAGYAVHKTFGFRADGNGMKNVSAEQMEYMAEVRQRNFANLMAQGHRSRMEGRGQGQGQGQGT